jgi:hypothetical protein
MDTESALGTGSSDSSGLIGHGTVFHTASAARTQVHIDASGPFLYFDLEISRRTLYGFQVSIGDKLDV